MVKVNEILDTYDKEYIESYTRDLMNSKICRKYPKTTEDYKNNHKVSLWCAAFLHCQVNSELNS